MAMNIERLLRLSADFHNFTADAQQFSAEKEEDELTMEELDFVAAAAAIPVQEQKKEK